VEIVRRSGNVYKRLSLPYFTYIYIHIHIQNNIPQPTRISLSSRVERLYCGTELKKGVEGLEDWSVDGLWSLVVLPHLCFNPQI